MAPENLLNFWNRTKHDLSQFDVSFTLEDVPERSTREYRTYQLVLNSFHGIQIRGWYSVPTDPPPNGRFPAVLAVPGYGGMKEIPTHLVVSGFVVLTLFPRAQGESSQEWQLDHGTKITYNLFNKDDYYYRYAYMDCIRGLDFLCCQAEVDSSRIGMWSRSQGGGLTLATASLDSRLSVAVAEEPFLCNYPEAINITSSPYKELYDYIKFNSDSTEDILNTLFYFDTLNLVQSIECPTLMNIGMKDETCPYNTIMPVFERIKAVKAIHIYPELPHSPCSDFNAHAMNWLRRYLGA